MQLPQGGAITTQITAYKSDCLSQSYDPKTYWYKFI